MYWFGERLLDCWGELAIQARLLSIHRTLRHKGVVEHIDLTQAICARNGCEDLLDLCRYMSSPSVRERSVTWDSIGYPLRIRQKALQAILLLLRPLDAWSSILLDTNLIGFVTTCGVERSEDTALRAIFAEVLRVLVAYCLLPCRCITCIRALRVSRLLLSI